MTDTVTKLEMATALADDPELELNKTQAKEFVDLVFEEMRCVLESGEEIKLQGLGNLVVLGKKARPGRNPRTGEETQVSARKVVTFRAGETLKERVAAYKAESSSGNDESST